MVVASDTADTLVVDILKVPSPATPPCPEPSPKTSSEAKREAYQGRPAKQPKQAAVEKEEPPANPDAKLESSTRLKAPVPNDKKVGEKHEDGKEVFTPEEEALARCP